MKKLNQLVRPHLLTLTPYSSARDEFTGEGNIFLDANENAYGSATEEPWNRYPDPYQKKIKNRISRIKNVPPDQIFLGNGSDEAIDLIIRIFCSPREDSILVMPPTYDIYEVMAVINETRVKKVQLKKDFQIDVPNVLEEIEKNTKIIFISSPNNPTGNSFSHSDITELLDRFDGIVVIDEAYIDFSRQESFLTRLEKYPNLIVIQTLSKAWGLAGLRLGMAFSSLQIIGLMNKIKFPYNINEATQKWVFNALQLENRKEEMVQAILDQRKFLEEKLSGLSIVEKVHPSDANFLLVTFKDAVPVYKYLLENSVIVRNRSKLVLCENALRITVGKPEENAALITYLKKFEAKK